MHSAAAAIMDPQMFKLPITFSRFCLKWTHFRPVSGCDLILGARNKAVSECLKKQISEDTPRTECDVTVQTLSHRDHSENMNTFLI